MKPQPLRPAVSIDVPEGTKIDFDAGTESGPEGSSFTVNDRSLGEYGVEEIEGCLVVVPGTESEASLPAKGSFKSKFPTGDDYHGPPKM